MGLMALDGEAADNPRGGRARRPAEPSAAAFGKSVNKDVHAGQDSCEAG